MKNNVKFTGTTVVTKPFPTTTNCTKTGVFQTTTGAACITDAQLHTELGTLAPIATRTLTHLYLVHLPHVETCAKAAIWTSGAKIGKSKFCDYHSQVFATTLTYGNMPFPTRCGKTQAANGTVKATTTVISITAHEAKGSIADPTAGNTWITATQWEIGELCA